MNTTAEHETKMTAIEANQQRISELQSTTNDNKILYENMDLRLNNLEGIYLKTSMHVRWLKKAMIRKWYNQKEIPTRKPRGKN